MLAVGDFLMEGETSIERAYAAVSLRKQKTLLASKLSHCPSPSKILGRFWEDLTSIICGIGGDDGVSSPFYLNF